MLGFGGNLLHFFDAVEEGLAGDPYGLLDGAVDVGGEFADGLPWAVEGGIAADAVGMAAFHGAAQQEGAVGAAIQRRPEGDAGFGGTGLGGRIERGREPCVISNTVGIAPFDFLKCEADFLDGRSGLPLHGDGGDQNIVQRNPQIAVLPFDKGQAEPWNVLTAGAFDDQVGSAPVEFLQHPHAEYGGTGRGGWDDRWDDDIRIGAVELGPSGESSGGNFPGDAFNLKVDIRGAGGSRHGQEHPCTGRKPLTGRDPPERRKWAGSFHGSVR